MKVYISVRRNDSAQYINTFREIDHKQFSQLIEIKSATSLRFMIFNSDFAYIEVWFINQKIKLLK